MESIKKIYKTGYGPSSSHTMGPFHAAAQFKKQFPNAESYRTTLYGSLALTGKGHLTDQAIIKAFGKTPCEIVWKYDETLPFHPNAMQFEALDDARQVTAKATAYSVGGGDIVEENGTVPRQDIYEMNELADILAWSNETGKSYWEYVLEVEDSDIMDYLNEVWKAMQAGIRRGLETEGVLPGGLGLQRKASSYMVKGEGYKDSLKSRSFLFAYALATAEENAAGGLIVTAPTCGSAGVLPAVLYHLQTRHDFTDTRILRALATAGLIANIIKEHASISGAVVGCQGEIGSACAMASAAACQMFGGSAAQIEYAAEMGLEHHLGLTCDPVAGLVQIPCIERCAFAAARALNCNMFAMLSDGKHRVHFDKVVATMRQTGKDLPSLYKETSQGGLAKFY